jgi:hypothetical protein
MDDFDLACAVLSSAVYREGRREENWTPDAPGAVRIPGMSLSDPITGFEATAYQYQGRVVIALAGTDPSRLNDWAANVMLFMGGSSAQLVLAAEFYEKVKAQYGSDITFTGHSLGGGVSVDGVDNDRISVQGGSDRLYGGADNEVLYVDPVAVWQIAA